MQHAQHAAPRPAWRPAATPAWSQGILLGAMAGRMACSVALTILLGRTLSPAEFGFFALVATVFGLAHEFTDMGSGNVAARGAARARADERVMLEGLLGLRLVLSLIAAAACGVLALFQGDAVRTTILLGAAAVLGFSYLSTLGMVFQLRQAQLGPSVLTVAVQAGTLGCCALMLAMGWPGQAFAVVLLLREVAVLLGMRTLAWRLLPYRPRPRVQGGAMGRMSGTAAVVAIGTVLYHAQFQAGPFFVQALRPAAELGAFGAALRPLVPMLFIPWILMLPLVPLLSALAAHDRGAFRRQAAGVLDMTAGAGAIAAVAAMQLAPAGLMFLYGPQFAEGPLSAVAALRWLAVPLGFSFFTAAASTALLADHRERSLLWLSVAGLVAYVAANLSLLPQYGFTGSAMATALAVLVLTIGGAVLVWRSAGLRPTLRTGLALLPAAALLPALQWLSGPPWLQLVLGGVLSGTALLALWHVPGFAGYRAEQAALSTGSPGG